MKTSKYHILPLLRKRVMGRSSGWGDYGNQPRYIARPLPKRRRVSYRNLVIPTITAAAAASTSTAAAVRPAVERIVRQEVPVTAPEESEGSETSWSDTSSSTEESDEEEQQQQQNQRSVEEVQLTEVRIDSTPNGNYTSRGSEGPPSGPVSVTLRDPDVLDCPICYEPLCSPVYQCENGHVACASCYTNVKNKCPSCKQATGYYRCMAIERVLQSAEIACQNKPHGCMATLNYSKKLAHEKTCDYAPCSCPHVGCEYVGALSRFFAHFARDHKQSCKRFHFNSAISISLDNNQKHIFLQDSDEWIVFILNRSIETFGSLANVVCVAPTSPKREFRYILKATAGGSSIKLKTFAEFMPKWTGQPPAKKCLIIPSDFISSSGPLKLELVIGRSPSSSTVARQLM